MPPAVETCPNGNRLVPLFAGAHRLFRHGSILSPLALARLSGAGILAALAVEVSEDLAERSGGEMDVALDGEASSSPDFLHFGEDKVPPLLFVATDVAKEAEVLLIRFAFGGKPRPVVPRAEELCVDGRVFVFLLAIERRQLRAQFCRKQFH